MGNEFFDVVSAYGELALIWDKRPVLATIAMHVRDPRKAGDHARPVRIAQASLNIVGAEELLVVGHHDGAVV